MVESTNAIIPIEAIKPHPENYRQHPDPQLAQLGASHQEFGQFRSVVVWSQPDGSYIQVAVMALSRQCAETM